MSQRFDLRVDLPATLNDVEAFCHHFRVWHAEACRARDRFASELLLREALINGVFHGGGTEGMLRCVLRGSEKRLFIAVSDHGPGFDWRERRQRPLDSEKTNGRGLAIYYQYANHVRFNALGNAVALLRVFRERAKGEVK